MRRLRESEALYKPMAWLHIQCKWCHLTFSCTGIHLDLRNLFFSLKFHKQRWRLIQYPFFSLGEERGGMIHIWILCFLELLASVSEEKAALKALYFKHLFLTVAFYLETLIALTFADLLQWKVNNCAVLESTWFKNPSWPFPTPKDVWKMGSTFCTLMELKVYFFHHDVSTRPG